MRFPNLGLFMGPLVLTLWSLCLATPLRAGGGDIQNGKLNLLVYFAYDEADPASWIPVFDEYSILMLNSTEGAMQLGTVQFTRCPDLQNEADIWILNDFSGARSHLSGLGRSGLHITISQTHKSVTGSSRGQFGLMHESGHYLWGCYDEYLGFVGNVRERSSLQFCSLDLNNVGCIMDGGTNVFPNNRRTEFCTNTSLNFTDTRHNRGVSGFISGSGQVAFVVTDQEYFLGRSCWSQIARSGVGGLNDQLTLPTQTPPAHMAVIYDQARLNGDLAVSLVIDVSGSMSAEGRLQQAILGGQVGVGLLRAEESLSIVAFNDVPRVVFGQQSATGAAKSAANVVLGNLVAGGGTASGSALISAVGQLARVSGCVEFIVIVTDGVSAAPNLADPSVSAALAAGGQAVYSVAIGSFPDVTALNAISASTGGAFYRVADATEIPGVLADIFSTAGSGTPVSVVAQEQVPPGGRHVEPFVVAARDQLLRVSLSFDPDADLDLTLTAPDGTSFFAASPVPGFSVFAQPGSLSLSLDDPLSGAWSASVGDPSGSAASFDLLIFVEGQELDINTLAAAAELTYPEPMQLSVSLVAGVPVGGAKVQAQVRRPDGTQVPCRFFDDGLAVHGDVRAGDGVYSTLFARYTGDGAYAFDILIDASAGVAASNEECGIYGRGAREDGQQVFVIEGFQACARHTLLLVGQDSFPSDGGQVSLQGHAAFRPLSELDVLQAPASIIGAFSLQVGASEALILEGVRLDFLNAGAQPDLADGMLLHLDRDADGRLDVPSVPLAAGALSADGKRLQFSQPGGQLAWLPAATTPHFLLTLGEAPPLLASRKGAFDGAFGGFLGGRSTGILRWGLAILVLAVWLRRKRSEWGETRRLQPLLPLCLLLLLGMPACGSGGGSGSRAPGSNVGAEQFVLEPSHLQFSGAVSGQPTVTLGLEQRFALDLLGH